VKQFTSYIAAIVLSKGITTFKGKLEEYLIMGDSNQLINFGPGKPLVGLAYASLSTEPCQLEDYGRVSEFIKI